MADGKDQPIIIKKVKGHGHGHHGGAWKVAYADFVTAMMAFFMVMWIMGLSDDVKNEIQGYFNDPTAFLRNPPKSRSIISLKGVPIAGKGKGPGGPPSQIESEVNDAKRLKQEIQAAIEASGSQEMKSLMKNVEMSITPSGLLIEFLEKSSEVFFQLGSAEVRPIARKLFAKVASILSKTDKVMKVNGHTDARRFPSSQYDNWDLSADRAIALKRVLRAHGVRESQIVRIRAFAATKLRIPSDPFHFSNRRVSLLLPFSMRSGQEKALPKAEIKTSTQAIFHKDIGVMPSSFPLDKSVRPDQHKEKRPSGFFNLKQ